MHHGHSQPCYPFVNHIQKGIKNKFEIQRLTRHIFVADRHVEVSGVARFAPKSSMDVTLTQLLASFMPVTATVQLLSLDLIEREGFVL